LQAISNIVVFTWKYYLMNIQQPNSFAITNHDILEIITYQYYTGLKVLIDTIVGSLTGFG
jgi:hypothetical protein